MSSPNPRLRSRSCSFQRGSRVFCRFCIRVTTEEMCQSLDLKFVFCFLYENHHNMIQILRLFCHSIWIYHDYLIPAKLRLTYEVFSFAGVPHMIYAQIVTLSSFNSIHQQVEGLCLSPIIQWCCQCSGKIWEVFRIPFACKESSFNWPYMEMARQPLLTFKRCLA